MKINTLKYFSFLSFILTGCDRFLYVRYSVINETNKNIKVHVPQYPNNVEQIFLSNKIDTIIELKPGEQLRIGSRSDIGFPWTTKKIYREHPGVCGLELIKNDSIIPLDCRTKDWHYKKKCSILTLQ